MLFKSFKKIWMLHDFWVQIFINQANLTQYMSTEFMGYRLGYLISFDL